MQGIIAPVTKQELQLTIYLYHAALKHDVLSAEYVDDRLNGCMLTKCPSTPSERDVKSAGCGGAWQWAGGAEDLLQFDALLLRMRGVIDDYIMCCPSEHHVMGAEFDRAGSGQEVLKIIWINAQFLKIYAILEHDFLATGCSSPCQQAGTVGDHMTVV